MFGLNVIRTSKVDIFDLTFLILLLLDVIADLIRTNLYVLFLKSVG